MIACFSVPAAGDNGSVDSIYSLGTEGEQQMHTQDSVLIEYASNRLLVKVINI